MTAAQQDLWGIDRLNIVPPSDLSAITHVDYTARVLTVCRATTPHYYALLKAFERRTGAAFSSHVLHRAEEPIVTPAMHIAASCERTSMTPCLELSCSRSVRSQRSQARTTSGNDSTNSIDADQASSRPEGLAVRFCFCRLLPGGAVIMSIVLGPLWVLRSWYRRCSSGHAS